MVFDFAYELLERDANEADLIAKQSRVLAKTQTLKLPTEQMELDVFMCEPTQ
jgi:hypothetical protein